MFTKSKVSSGVQGFSAPHKPMVIWAADSVHTSQEVRGFLSAQGIEFTPMLGSYVGLDGKRVVEMSYCTSWADFLCVNAMLASNQESVLVLDGKDSHNRRKATLIFMDQSKPPIDLGRMFDVSAIEADQWGDAWSIPLDGKRDGSLVAFVCAQIDKFGQPVKPVQS